MSNTVNMLDVSLSESGGADVFTSTSAVYVINAVQNFKKRIKDFATPAAFPDDGGINLDALQRSFNKTAMAEWLGTALEILDRAVTQIEAAKKLESVINCAEVENKSLKNEMIADQRTIIDLQQKLIEKKDSDFQGIRKTVETEVQSYAAIVETTCEKALAPENFKKVVKQVKQSEDRARNVIIYGLVEEEDENLTTKVSNVLEILQEKPVFSIPQRIGVSAGTSRPVKISLTSSQMVSELLKKSKLLQTQDAFKSVFIAPDRTKEERELRKKLVDDLKAKRSKHSNLKFAIRNGSVVQV